MVGFYIVAEALFSLVWPRNDKSWFAQAVRLTRVLVGVALLAGRKPKIRGGAL